MTRFPQPSGPHSIGTVVYHLVDQQRTDIFSESGKDPRELMVQVWYPAITEANDPRAPYIEDSALLRPLAALMRLPDSAFAGLDKVPTNGVPGAPMAGNETYPVLVFSHGRCGFRQHNTVLVEELASHGYVVVAIDHPYAATGVAFPGGRSVMFDRRLLPPWPRSLAPGLDEWLIDDALPFLGMDVTFVIDQLARLNDHDPSGPLSGRLDMSRLATFGVSLGGMLAAEACVADPRVAACLIMDAYLPRQVVQTGLQRPTMWITRDAGTMCLEGWSRDDIDDTHATMRSVFDRLPGPGYKVLIPGMYHVDFSDGRLSPLIGERGISGSVPLDRSLGLVSAYSRAFFDRHLCGRDLPLLETRSSEFPEVLFERRQPTQTPNGVLQM